MKFSVFLFIAFFISSCSSDDDLSLPEITEDGMGGIGCLVDGEVIVPKRDNVFSGPTQSVTYRTFNDEFHFALFFCKQGDDNTKCVEVQINLEELIADTTYNLTSPESADGEYTSNFGSYSLFSNLQNIQFYTNENINGSVTITNINTDKNTVSGTFEFNATKSNGGVVSVTKGRFDTLYVF